MMWLLSLLEEEQGLLLPFFSESFSPLLSSLPAVLTFLPLMP
jgi:hypothetical protein